MISIDYSLIIVILNFVLLLIVLNKLLFKPMKKFLSDRQQEVKKEMTDARINREEAVKLLKQRDEELKSSSEEIRNLTKQAKREAEKNSEEILKEAKARERAIVKESEEMIELRKSEAVKEIEADVINLVSELTGKIIGKKIDSDTDKKLIDSLMKEGK
ncbi:MAG: F0F1 ATP synthase subunit B [Candidatus Cloacimonetes bacterium]|nr:F0F1 ATP synthase subunit B [Candidatus Cloacimonadota bacterium]